MPTTFANTIDGNDIYAKRAECDAAGNTLSTTYATKGELPTVDQTYDGTSTNPQSGTAIAGALASYTPTTSLATVATTGDFDDLTSKPTVKPLVAGSNITITENANDITIAAAGGGGGSYTAGTGIDITSDVISVDTSVVATQTDLAALKQVPAVTSSDSGKVLKASYSGGTGSYTWDGPIFVAIYGTTTYQAVIDAISSGSLVFCQIDNSPTTYRRAVLSYVDSGLGKVEFLYYRSVGTHSASQQGDQAIIYMVDSTNAWTTTTREAYTAIAAGTHMSQSYSNGTLTLNAAWPTVDQTYSAASTNAQSGTAVAGAIAGVEQVPTVTSDDNNKVLKASYSGGVGSYSWQTESGGGGSYTAGTGIDITNDVISVDTSVVATQTDLADKEDAFDVGTGLEMDTSGATPTLQVEAPVDIVAGPGIVIDNPDGNTLRVSVAQAIELTLFESEAGSDTFSLSESIYNFDRCRIVFKLASVGIKLEYEFYVVSGTTSYIMAVACYNPSSNNFAQIQCGRINIGSNGTTITLSDLKRAWLPANGTETQTGYSIFKIVGIHRIAGGN